MGHRLSKIYTRTGDAGETGLGDGSRVPKDSLRIDVIGDIDELNSAVGMLIACGPRTAIRDALVEIQQCLFDLGSEIAVPTWSVIDPNDVAWLEERLDELNAELPPLKEFILPGGGPGAAAAHLARAVCRRAERHMVALARHEKVGEAARAYVNRLSDYLFVASRVLARDEGGSEVLWRNDHKQRRERASDPPAGPER
ncbi:MAG TPA: cob(I)yrinic acid a,c-diamide adenosyltransferase [Burkholderiaceae bacterium]|nr:cob(I)yrinic acid a,c-diamide adenosyltransferase [Burkholderiaceae bacterium]